MVCILVISLHQVSNQVTASTKFFCMLYNLLVTIFGNGSAAAGRLQLN